VVKSLARFPGHTYSVGEEPTARYNGKATPPFSEEFKRDAVGRVADGNRPLTQVARELDVHPHLCKSGERSTVRTSKPSPSRKTVNRLKMRFVVSDVKTLVYAKIATS
jgi:transposase-like protein